MNQLRLIYHYIANVKALVIRNNVSCHIRKKSSRTCSIYFLPHSLEERNLKFILYLIYKDIPVKNELAFSIRTKNASNKKKAQ